MRIRQLVYKYIEIISKYSEEYNTDDVESPHPKWVYSTYIRCGKKSVQVF